MGTVYAAVGPRGQRVAVKVVHVGQAADEQFRARFRREVKLLARVSGPCLVPLLDADPEAETPWLATAYVPGLTLDRHIPLHGPLTGGQLYLLASGTASALAAVHAAGIVHRDLKPANVILAPDGPKVLDFGISHVADGTAVTRTGMLTGTPGWISPEYYRDGSVGATGDLFTWAALLAFAATGRHPFGAGNPEAVAFRVLNGEPDLTSTPADLAELLSSCLAKDPTNRPSTLTVAHKTAELLRQQATQVIEAEHGSSAEVPHRVPLQWQTPTVEDPVWTTATVSRPGRRLGLIASVAGAVLALIAAGTWLSLGSGRAQGRSPYPPQTAVGHPGTAIASVDVHSSPTGTSASALPQSTATSTPSGRAQQTRVITISPWTLKGAPARDVTITGRTSGSCFGTAESSMRADAWRCTAGSRIFDPCFSPDSDPADTSVLCMDGAPDRMVEVTVPQGLPGNNDHIPGGPDLEPILVVMDNGARCTFIGGGTATLAGQRLNYGCDNGADLYGYPNKTAALWTISYSAPNSGESISTPITTAYQ